jgi:hypothetical protein
LLLLDKNQTICLPQSFINPSLKMKKFLFYLLILVSNASIAQVSRDTELYKSIMKKDSLLFNVGFNTCDISQFERLLSDKFEFS